MPCSRRAAHALEVHAREVALRLRGGELRLLLPRVEPDQDVALSRPSRRTRTRSATRCPADPRATVTPWTASTVPIAVSSPATAPAGLDRGDGLRRHLEGGVFAIPALTCRVFTRPRTAMKTASPARTRIIRFFMKPPHSYRRPLSKADAIENSVPGADRLRRQAFRNQPFAAPRKPGRVVRPFQPKVSKKLRSVEIPEPPHRLFRGFEISAPPVF